MPIPPAVAIGVPAAASILSALLVRRPKVPDTVTPVRGRVVAQQQGLFEDIQAVRDELEADDAAAGRGSGSGSISGRDRFFRAGSRAVSEFRNRAADLLGQAEAQRQQAKFLADQQAFEARSRNISGALSALSFLMQGARGPAAAGGFVPPVPIPSLSPQGAGFPGVRSQLPGAEVPSISSQGAEFPGIRSQLPGAEVESLTPGQRVLGGLSGLNLLRRNAPSF